MDAETCITLILAGAAVAGVIAFKFKRRREPEPLGRCVTRIR